MLCGSTQELGIRPLLQNSGRLFRADASPDSSYFCFDAASYFKKGSRQVLYSSCNGSPRCPFTGLGSQADSSRDYHRYAKGNSPQRKSEQAGFSLPCCLSERQIRCSFFSQEVGYRSIYNQGHLFPPTRSAGIGDSSRKVHDGGRYL